MHVHNACYLFAIFNRCKFPTVFVLYAAITYFFGGIVRLMTYLKLLLFNSDIIIYISSVANEQLFCNSEDDLFSSINESTTFCTISGKHATNKGIMRIHQLYA